MSKENTNIDELLSCYIDDELTERQRIEVQRLISHDKNIEKRLAELKKCKSLVGSLPSSQPTADMLADIKLALERRILLGTQEQYTTRREGARHLFVRNLVAAAAMIVLVAGLAAVIYMIVSPAKQKAEPFIAAEPVKSPVSPAVQTPPLIEDKAVAVVKYDKPAEAANFVSEKKTVFSGAVELKTKAVIAVDAFINRTIENNSLLGHVELLNSGLKNTYELRCSRHGMELLLSDLSTIWDKFNSATLSVDTEQIGKRIVVNNVNIEQIGGIVSRQNPADCVAAAKDIAVLNSLEHLSGGNEILAAISDESLNIVIPPKPVLTSGQKEKTEDKAVTFDKQDEKLYITITVVNSD